MAGRLSKPVLTTDLPDYYPALSRKLFKVMEDIGASIEIRDQSKKGFILREIMETIKKKMFWNTEVSPYICGSRFEGTTTPGMHSDVDCLNVQEYLPVVVDTDSAQQYEDCLLMVQDSHTPAGYAKLQYVRNGMPLSVDPYLQLSLFGDLKVDREGRVLANVDSVLEEGMERHGPAETFIAPVANINQDGVLAVRCRRWSDCADEWLTRPRRYNWPDPVLFDKCKSLGCFFVEVGHPTSDEKLLQWRISFSLQERLLVTNFNSTQLKCYILMKLMKKEILPPLLQEETITSYHCKTCLLYMIENTPASFWKEENLLTCFYNCIKMIYRWAEIGICPNYFIPDENMFDGRMSEQLRVRLCSVLRTILASNFKFLLRIKSDDLGTRLENCCTTPNIRTGYSRRDAKVHSPSNICTLLDLLYGVTILSKEGNPSERRLFAAKQKLLETETVTEHTREETQRVISFLLPYIDLRLMELSIVAAKRRQAPAAVILVDLMSDKWHEISSQSDPFSAKLKQANYLYMLGYHRVALDILEPLVDKINENLVSLCVCPKRKPCGSPRSLLGARFSAEVILKHLVIPCVQFSQEEKDLTPTALYYEMISLPGGTTLYEKCLRSLKTDRSTVDGKILLYFMLYLNHRALGMEAHARADIENFHWIIRTDGHLGHKSTALNLLGWIYKEMGRVDKAMKCFNNSLIIGPQDLAAIQPQENAAIRHIKDIENVLLCMIQSVRS